MANVLIVAYLLIVIALIAVILLQRSEGGALGIGGGGGGFMTARGSANLLTRTTAILATLFFVTAIGLTLLSEFDRGSSGILERASQGQESGAAPTSVLDALNSLQSGAAPADGANAALAQQQNTDAPDLAIPAQPTPETSAPAPAAPAAQTPVQSAPANSSAPAQPATN